MYFAYVAALPEDGRLDWGGTTGFNRPRKALLPRFEINEAGFGAFWKRRDEAGKTGRVVDGAAIAVRLDKSGLCELLIELFCSGGGEPRRRDEHLAFANAMSPSDQVAVIAFEV